MPFGNNPDSSSSFLAVMSHELRTPMQSVFGMLELIERQNLNAETRAMVKTARNSAAALLEILDDVLDLAKMGAARMEIEHIELPVRTLVQGTLEALQIRTLGKEIQLIDEIAEDVPRIILGDPKRLRQVLMNLTGNALKFTESGSVKIRVTCAAKKDERNITLCFEVMDTGIGLSEEAQQKIFEPYVQADASTARKYGGTGLGLAICKKLVELMGGTLRVESVLGLGSTFSFDIPVQIADETVQQDLPDLQGLSVLSVEDHPQGAAEIARTLKSMGAQVTTTATIAEAQNLIDQRLFDVAVIDQGLPDGLGVDFARHALHRRPSMALLMYTVRDDEGLKHELKNLGIGYLVKPAGRYKLGRAIAELRRRARPQIRAEDQRVMLVEDTHSVRILLEKQLKLLNVTYDSFENAAAALSAIQNTNYGLVMTDLHMPDMDGYEFVQAVRNRESDTGRHMPFVLLTADVELMEGQKYIHKGFDELLIKPISIGQVQSVLLRWGIIDTSDVLAITPISSNTQNPVDLDALAAQMGAGRADAIGMLKSFVELMADSIAELEQIHAADDTPALKEAAHSLKGAARSVCAPRLGDLASDLQNATTEGALCSDLVPDLVHGIRTEFDAIHRFAETLTV